MKRAPLNAEELILPAAIEIVEITFRDNFVKQSQFILLTNDTDTRQIGDLAENVEHPSAFLKLA